jgi:hypothetical protein
MVEGLEKTLQGFWRQLSLPAPSFVIISDCEEEKQVERKATEKEEKVKWLVEVEQLAYFSSIPIEGGFFNVEVDSPHIPIVVPPKVWSKYMMRRKGKEQVEEGNSPTKITWKWAPIEAKEI